MIATIDEPGDGYKEEGEEISIEVPTKDPRLAVRSYYAWVRSLPSKKHMVARVAAVIAGCQQSERGCDEKTIMLLCGEGAMTITQPCAGVATACLKSLKRRKLITSESYSIPDRDGVQRGATLRYWKPKKSGNDDEEAVEAAPQVGACILEVDGHKAGG